MTRRQRRRYIQQLHKADMQRIHAARERAQGWRKWFFLYRDAYDDAVLGHRRIFYVAFLGCLTLLHTNATPVVPRAKMLPPRHREQVTGEVVERRLREAREGRVTLIDADIAIAHARAAATRRR